MTSSISYARFIFQQRRYQGIFTGPLWLYVGGEPVFLGSTPVVYMPGVL